MENKGRKATETSCELPRRALPSSQSLEVDPTLSHPSQQVSPTIQKYLPQCSPVNHLSCKRGSGDQLGVGAGPAT